MPLAVKTHLSHCGRHVWVRVSPLRLKAPSEREPIPSVADYVDEWEDSMDRYDCDWDWSYFHEYLEATGGFEERAPALLTVKLSEAA